MREDYGDNAIGFVEVKREGSTCIVQSKVCPEHKVRNTGYTVVCKVDEDADVIAEMTCQDCAASAGKNTLYFFMGDFKLFGMRLKKL